MKQKIKSQLPSGFKPITGLGSAWKPAKPGEVLQGIMVGSKPVDLPKNGRIPARTVSVYSIMTKEGGKVDVWESGGLKALAQIKKGKPVFIQYIGKKKIKGQSNPMREYLVATK